MSNRLIYEVVKSTFYGKPVWNVQTMEGVHDGTYNTKSEAVRRCKALNEAQRIHEERGYTEEG